MNSIIEVTDVLFAVFATLCIPFSVLGFLSYLEYIKYYHKAEIQPYYLFEHLKFAEKYRGDAYAYGFMALLTGLLAILMVL